MQLEKQLEEYFNLKNAICAPLNTVANYAVSVTTPTDRYALKLYNPASRTPEEVQWELDLTLHLIQKGAPIAKPVIGKEGYIQSILQDGEQRTAMLFAWAPGEKPNAEESTYILLGKAAAQIHNAADDFTSNSPREKYDAHKLIDEQLRRMKDQLVQSDTWTQVEALTNRLKNILTNGVLDYGICHMDLTLDNVHRDGEYMTVFDLDSAGESWRAIEPYGVLKSSAKHFQAWLEGYRSKRSFSKEDEHAVYAFVIIGEIRNIVWKLGLAKSSRGDPILKTSDLPKIVEEWFHWEKKHNL